MKNYTDITVLVDRSGSMASIKNAMEESFRSFLREHRKTEVSRISLYQFDSEHDQQIDYVNVPIKNAGELVINPRGGTPLLDAFCKTIDSTGDRLRNLNEKDRPKRVLFIVITDGEENASKRFTSDDVRNRVLKQRNDYNWEFVYLGANQDAFKVSKMYGLNIGSTMSYSASPYFVGENSQFANYMSSTASFASGATASTATVTDSMRRAALDEEDQKKFQTSTHNGMGSSGGGSNDTTFGDLTKP